MNRKTKSLTPGELRRLSIAEEMVHGPNLLLIDEPTTGLSGSDESVLMTTFREMVNADRTVVATMFQPSAAVFQLFDTLHLLNKGHVVYHGPISNAVQFFVNSPFSFDFLSYGSATDYLLDISGGAIKDSKVFLN